MKEYIAAVVILPVVIAGTAVANASALSPARQAVQERRCTIAEKRIENVLARMKAIGERRTTAYQNLKVRLQEAITKAEKAGYDATTLKADLSSLDVAIKNYREKTVNLYGNLQSTQDFACGESEGAFVEALQAARAQMPEVKIAAEQVQSVFKEKVKPDLQAFRDWLKNKKA